MARSTAASIFSLFGSKAVTLLIALFFTPILVRFLGPGLYGRYATLISIFFITDVLIGAGLNDSIRKYISEERSSTERNQIFGFHLRLLIGLCCSFAALYIVATLTGVIRETLGPEFVPLFYLFAFFIVGRQFREFVRRTLMGLKLEKYSEPLKIGQKSLFSVLALLFVAGGYGVPGILIADIIVSCIITITGGYAISKHLTFASVFHSSPEGELRHEILTFAAASVAYFACLNSLYHVDILMLTWWTESEIVGYYKGALAIAETLWVLPMAVQMSMIQSTSELWQNEEYGKISQMAAKATRYVALFSILCAIGLAVLADSFVPVFLGAEFTPTVTPLILLLPGVVGFAIARPILSITQASGNMRTVILATLAAAILNFVLNGLLIPRYGMVGAAISTSIGYGTLPVFQFFAARNVGYSPFEGFSLVRVAVISTVSASVIFATDVLIPSDLLSLALVPPVGFVCFLSLALILGVITREEREKVRAIVPY